MIWRCPAAGPPRDGPVLFLDRDGVIIVDRDYLADPDGVELVPGVADALLRAAAAGYALIGISNQSGIGRGRFGATELVAVMNRVDEELARCGVRLDAMYYCPHAPADACRCRKPEPGLLEEASVCFRWTPDRSWVIGDKASDVDLGRRHGLGAALVGTGHGRTQRALVEAAWPADPRVLLVPDPATAIDRILAADTRNGGLPR